MTWVNHQLYGRRLIFRPANEWK